MAQHATSEDNVKRVNPLPGIHSYVNQVLDRVAATAGVAGKLTSHSFRRGGAQQANGAGMCVQWIFNRGAWNITATNKAFAYVFNTPAEDHIVGRGLGSHAPERPVHLLSLDTFGVCTHVKIRGVASALFWSSLGLEMPSYNINARVLDTLMAYLLRHYPELKRLNANGPAVQRIEACALEKAITLNELLTWSSHLACNPRTLSTPSITESTHTPASTPDITEHPMFRHQEALIEQLTQVNQKLDTRLAAMEATF